MLVVDELGEIICRFTSAISSNSICVCILCGTKIFISNHYPFIMLIYEYINLDSLFKTDSISPFEELLDFILSQFRLTRPSLLTDTRKVSEPQPYSIMLYIELRPVAADNPFCFHAS